MLTFLHQSFTSRVLLTTVSLQPFTQWIHYLIPADSVAEKSVIGSLCNIYSSTLSVIHIDFVNSQIFTVPQRACVIQESLETVSVWKDQENVLITNIFFLK